MSREPPEASEPDRSRRTLKPFTEAPHDDLKPAPHFQIVATLFSDRRTNTRTHTPQNCIHLRTQTICALDFARFAFDAQNWQAEVGLYVGSTDLYISPYGYHLSNESAWFRYLVEEAGFNVYCPIRDGTTVVSSDDNLVFERRALDGYALMHFAEDLRPYFDAEEIWDDARGKTRGGERDKWLERQVAGEASGWRGKWPHKRGWSVVLVAQRVSGVRRRTDGTVRSRRGLPHRLWEWASQWPNVICHHLVRGPGELSQRQQEESLFGAGRSE